jgi:hypothetical protein
MADLFADEHVPPQVLYWLRRLGHNCPLVRQYCEDKSGDAWDDIDVLRFAAERKWAVLTFNARHFLALAAANPWHHGIVIGEPLPESERKIQARRIDDAVRDAIRRYGDLRGQIVETRVLGPLPKRRKGKGNASE